MVAPEPAREHHLRALEALRDLAFLDGPHLLVRKAVDVRHLESVDQHAVEAGELARAACKRRRMHLRPVARHRSRKMNGVQLPEPGTRWVETNLCCHLSEGHQALLSRS